MLLHRHMIQVKFLLQGNLLMHSASMNSYGNKACINDKFHPSAMKKKDARF